MHNRGPTIGQLACRWLGFGALGVGGCLLALASTARGAVGTVQGDFACLAISLLLISFILLAYGFTTERPAPRRYEVRSSRESVWSLPPQMLSERAKVKYEDRVAAERARAADEAAHAAQTAAYHAAILAARLLIEHAGAWAEDVRGLERRCVRDGAFARRLYHAAARRLHPDRNGGHDHPDWQRVQDAVARLREYQAASGR